MPEKNEDPKKLWDGEERRQPASITRNEYEGLLRWMERMDDDLAKHLTQEIKSAARLEQIESDTKEIKDVLRKLTDAWTQAQGAAKIAKLLFFIIGPLVGAIAWLSTHVTWAK